ncbi:hypothetical protein [Peptostreptococcus stomatis]
MNKNKGYDFLNDGNFDISSYDRQDLNEFEKAKLKRDIHKSIKKDTRLAGFNKKIVAAGLVMMTLVGLYQVPSVRAYTRDIIDNVRYSIADAMDNEAYKPYSNIVHKAIEDKGIGLQLEDALMYDDRIQLTFLAKGDGKTMYSPDDLVFNIGGTYLKPKGSMGHSFQKDGIEYNCMTYTFDKDIKDYLGNNKNVAVYVRSLMGFSEEDANKQNSIISGDWAFKFTVNNDFVKDSLHINPGINIKSKGIEVNVKDIIIRPTGVVEAKLKINNSNKKNYSYLIEAKNDKGELLELESSYSDRKETTLIQSELSKLRVDRDALKNFTFKLYASELPEKSGHYDQNENKFQIGDDFVIK